MELELSEDEEGVLLEDVGCSKMDEDELPAAELIVNVPDDEELCELELEGGDDDRTKLLDVDGTRSVEVEVLETI